MSLSLDLRLAVAAHYSEDARVQWLQAIPTDWDMLAHEAIVSRLAPLLYDSLQKFPRTDVPADAFARLRQVYLATGTRNMVMLQQLKQVTDALDEIGVRYILLKGAALIQDVYGGNPALRPMSDVDILVDSADFQTVRILLESLGETKTALVYDNFTLHHQGFRLSNKIVIELHSRLLNLASYAEKPLFTQLWESSIDRSILSSEYQFIHLCAHAYLHHNADIPHFGADAAFVSQHIYDWHIVFDLAHELDLTIAVKWGIKVVEMEWFTSFFVLSNRNQLQPSLRENALMGAARRPFLKELTKILIQPTLARRFGYARAKLFPSRQWLALHSPELNQMQPPWKLHIQRMVNVAIRYLKGEK